MSNDAIQLEVFKHLFASVAEEMGVRLKRSAFSPNIKERCDYSCAVFNAQGVLIAQAEHIPVHLGAMPLSVQACLKRLTFASGDVAIVNDPYEGGTHLPDITLVSPVFSVSDGQEVLLGFVANRAHHSDVGGMSPGSMPLSRELYQEGIIIPAVKLVSAGQRNQGLWDFFLANVRTPIERAGDLHAQLAANRTGIERLQSLVERYGQEVVSMHMEGLLTYSERMTRKLIVTLPDGTYRYEDYLDNDGIDSDPIKIAVAITIQGEEMVVDFEGSAPQCKGSVNAVYAITVSATAYVLRCLLGLDIPGNSGCMAPVTVLAPEGSVIKAIRPAAVAAGNVETAQRIVDVLIGALAQACPDRVPAASQGTMNNVTIGGWDPERQRTFAYYETLGGGMGAGHHHHGASGVHSHMTNTLNTPVEALEYAYPFRIIHYGIREGTGGDGVYRGGEGVTREIEFLHEAQVTILSDRRQTKPYGLAGGIPGMTGRNVLIRNGEERVLPGKIQLDVCAGDRLRIETPGGGGYGREKG
ncbi:hydantoinase B/oxoprolinase family protein [Candidatus Nitronereus thalassa]|uniref:Hydantoinase B/oxoprolinase family protein n=1 Tax=Candidatus Nitronereus thalassa TaxID=3020898 RepID=A0ABU3K6X1_9BACT|nr:hydantoinase B/oxoprolinase family protein [Candidatus Nitronereus thalassa]MDT7042138.1 hydantoinase B/oxoprolinase family protein [Candidatus Nitronereus thalassa]